MNEYEKQNKTNNSYGLYNLTKENNELFDSNVFEGIHLTNNLRTNVEKNYKGPIR